MLNIICEEFRDIKINRVYYFYENNCLPLTVKILQIKNNKMWIKYTEYNVVKVVMPHHGYFIPLFEFIN
jgi:hypothetical protein